MRARRDGCLPSSPSLTADPQLHVLDGGGATHTLGVARPAADDLDDEGALDGMAAAAAAAAADAADAAGRRDAPTPTSRLAAIDLVGGVPASMTGASSCARWRRCRAARTGTRFSRAPAGSVGTTRPLAPLAPCAHLLLLRDSARAECSMRPTPPPSPRPCSLRLPLLTCTVHVATLSPRTEPLRVLQRRAGAAPRPTVAFAHWLALPRDTAGGGDDAAGHGGDDDLDRGDGRPDARASSVPWHAAVTMLWPAAGPAVIAGGAWDGGLHASLLQADEADAGSDVRWSTARSLGGRPSRVACVPYNLP